MTGVMPGFAFWSQLYDPILAAAIILFAIVLTITCINLLVSKKHVHY